MDGVACQFDGLGACLAGFPAGLEPLFDVGLGDVGAGGRSCDGWPEGVGRSLAPGEVGVEGGFVIEAVGEVAEVEQA